MNNVVYAGSDLETYYTDAGSEWIHLQGNIQFDELDFNNAVGGCSPTGNFLIEDNYFTGVYSEGSYCEPAKNIYRVGNTTLTASSPNGQNSIPYGMIRPNTVPNDLLTGAGLSGSFQSLTINDGETEFYVSPVSPSGQVLIAGEGFTQNTAVPSATSVQYLSPNFLIATVPSGQSAPVIVGHPQGRIDDTSPYIVYSKNWTLSTCGLELDNTAHWTSLQGESETLTFTGTGVSVYGELNTTNTTCAADNKPKGLMDISVDNGPITQVKQTITNGVFAPAVALFTQTGLKSGSHTIKVTNHSNAMMVTDGFEVIP